VSVPKTRSGCATPALGRDVRTGRPLGDDDQVLLRLVYVGLIQLFATVRLLGRSSADKDVEMLVLRHQLAVLQRQNPRPKMNGADRTVLAALLHRTPRTRLRHLQLLVSPSTVLRWHLDLLRCCWAGRSKPKRLGRPPTPATRPRPGVAPGK